MLTNGECPDVVLIDPQVQFSLSWPQKSSHHPAL